MVDIWLLILPLVAIYKLQLHSTRRIGLTIVVSTGLVLAISKWDKRSLLCTCKAVVASAVSIYFRHQIEFDEDKTWTDLDVGLL